VHSPYLWAGTNNYESGKYVADGVWSSAAVDQQLGIVPVMRKMIELAPDLAFAGKVAAAPVPIAAPPVPAPAPLGLGTHGEHDTRWLQRGLNLMRVDGTPLLEDGSYGRRTRAAVLAFQRARGIEADGIAGPATATALETALAGTPPAQPGPAPVLDRPPPIAQPEQPQQQRAGDHNDSEA
jgi:peptidoglycan hydrolase-like protein with peptidoglycan-binding domain